jgi:hypothetical protein
MDIRLNSTYLKVSIVTSCLIKTTPIKIVTRRAFWFWERDEIEEKDNWTLEMHYKCFEGRPYTYTLSSGDYNQLKTSFDAIMKQISDQDSQYADKLLEEAIINGGTK